MSDVDSLSQAFTDADLPVAVDGRNQCATYNYLCFKHFLVPRLDNLWGILEKVLQQQKQRKKVKDLQFIPRQSPSSHLSRAIVKELETLIMNLHNRERFVEFYQDMYTHQMCVSFNKNSLAPLDQQELHPRENHNITSLSIIDIQNMGDVSNNEKVSTSPLISLLQSLRAEHSPILILYENMNAGSTSTFQEISS